MRPQFSYIQTRWHKLSPLNRNMIAIGFPVVCCLIVYVFFIVPFRESVVQLNSTIKNNKTLLTEMQVVSQKINATAAGDTMPQQASVLEMISKVQSSIQHSAIKTYFVDFKEGDNRSIIVRFNGVTFDQLTLWLIPLWNEEGVIVKNIDVVELAGLPGQVNAELSLGV